jgi:general L-amino acid transport system substrate-binding protein
MRAGFGLALLLAIAAVAMPARADGVADNVRANKLLVCGVVGEATDANKIDQHGDLSGLGGEICKAVGVAVLGEAAQVRLVTEPVEAAGLRALQQGGIDLLVGATPNATDGAHYGVAYGPPVFYDSLMIMAHQDAGIRSLADLAGRGVCYVLNTDNERLLQAAMRARAIRTIPLPFEEEGEMEAALVVGHCDAIAADLSKLAQARAGFHKQSDDFVLLPERLTLEPIAPAYRQGDAQWAGIVDWTVYALLQAEANGVTAGNVTERRGSGDLAVERLLGEDYATAQALGLVHDWAAHVIAAVGNYGEIYRRTAGEQSPLHLPRGLNALWSDGGLMQPLPMR